MDDPNDNWNIDEEWRNKIIRVGLIAKECGYPELDDFGFWANTPGAVINLILKLWKLTP